jgi:hypothetical protein
MAQNVNTPEDAWIRYRIGRLRELCRSVIDAQTVRAINELIDEAEERLQALEPLDPMLRNGLADSRYSAVARARGFRCSLGSDESMARQRPANRL